jgi:hypothetical protein
MQHNVVKVVGGFLALSIISRLILGTDSIAISEVQCFDSEEAKPITIVDGVRYVGCPERLQNQSRRPIWYRFLTGAPL